MDFQLPIDILYSKKNLIVDLEKFKSPLDVALFLKKYATNLSYDMNMPASCSNSSFYFSFSNPTTIKEQADWLKAYSDIICYEDSYAIIEKLHHMTEPIHIELFTNSLNSSREISIYNFVTNHLRHDFSTYNYEKFIQIELTNNNLTVNLVDDLSNDPTIKKTYYSFPFFRSLIEIHRITDFSNTFFTFNEFQMDGTMTIGIKIANQTMRLEEYYDFSHTPPPRGGGVSIYPNQFLV